MATTDLDTPEGRKKYITRVAELMKTAFKPDDLIKRLDALEKRVQPVLAVQDAGAGQDYKNQVNRLREAILLPPEGCIAAPAKATHEVKIAACCVMRNCP